MTAALLEFWKQSPNLVLVFVFKALVSQVLKTPKATVAYGVLHL